MIVLLLIYMVGQVPRPAPPPPPLAPTLLRAGMVIPIKVQVLHIHCG